MRVRYTVPPGMNRIAPATYSVPNVSEYEAWRREHCATTPNGDRHTPRASTLRRIVQLRQAGDNFTEIGRCCGMTAATVKGAYDRLPDRLREAPERPQEPTMTALHFNAAMRVLRKEMVRLDDAKRELTAGIDDPRLPAGVCIQQIQQCDREMAEIAAAHDMLEAAMADQKAAA